jgi:soluble cytochrome b562
MFSRLVGLTILLLLIPAASIYIILAQSPEGEIDKVEKELRVAFTALDEALRAGADRETVKMLIDKMNSILNTLDKAKALMSAGQIDEAKRLAESALITSQRIRGEAESIFHDASQRLLTHRLAVWLSVPVLSFIATLLISGGYKLYRRRTERLLLKMAIKVKKSEEA